MSNRKEVLILGAGVSGLTTATVLQGLGYKVRIWAKDFPPHTTSNVAPAIWYPEKIEPVEMTKKWAIASYKKFLELSENPNTGVLKKVGRKLFHRSMGNPWWKDEVIGYRQLTEKECNGAVCGHEFTGFVIDTSVYLEHYLLYEFKKNGGLVAHNSLTSIEDAFKEADWVINCVGFASRELVGDTSLISKRGQLVRVAKIAREEFILDTDHPSGMIYIVPRIKDCILGTVSEEGRENLEVDLSTSAQILERCALYYPEIKNLEVLSHSVGLRPSRPKLRVEEETLPGGKRLSHNYGHSGNGVTLSWGCALTVSGVKL